ncbi:MAG: glycerophosphodiester phosphodiesterase family protein [Candidatus Hydrogenedentota bacterium]
MLKHLTIRALIACALVLSTNTSLAQDPIVIAHRGASGYLPEHTLEAYTAAHIMGADYIEPDLVLTKDNVFICLHDIHLEGTTNVEEVFPDRHRKDGSWYPIDFTLAEIKTLRNHERLDDRFPLGKSNFEIPTFREMIELVQGLNQTTGREAGIYPELKGPAFHAKEGHPVEAALLSILTEYGYEGSDAKVFIQSFEIDSLRKIRNEFNSKLPLIMVMGDASLLDKKGLDDLATFVNGIGPSKSLVERDPNIVKEAHARGLKVHPYTFRADAYSKRKYDSFEKELDTFYNTYKVDGVFTDFPDQVVRFLGR